MKTKVCTKIGGKRADARFVETMVVAITIFATFQARASLIIEDFDSYSNGALFGNGRWTNTVPGGITTGMTVTNDPNAISSPNVAQFFDNTSSSLGIRYAVGQSGVGVISFYARELTNNLSNSSGFFMRLNSDTLAGINSPDPFFQAGFSSSGPDLEWVVNPGGGGAQQIFTLNNVVTSGTWYKFYMDYNISHTTLGNTNRVQLQITDVDTSTVLVNTQVTFGNNNGGRTHFGSFDFITGSVSDPSTYQVDNIAVPEPSSVAMMVSAGGIIWLRLRRRQS